MAHIPDGFLSLPVTGATLGAAAALTVVAARRTGASLDDRAAPSLGVATAAMFAAQMVNFPVAAGTSGHLLGATLIAVVLGPWAAYLMTVAVLIGQAVLFGDGGITALGANALNIGGGGALLGYALYRGLVVVLGDGPRARGTAAGLAAYPVTVVSGALAGLELGLSGTAPTAISASAMASVYAVIGLVEAAVTGLAVWAIARRGGAYLHGASGARARPPAVLILLGMACVVAGAVSLVASGAPDGLRRLAIDLGFAAGTMSWLGAPFAGYRAFLPGSAGTAAAGLLGVALLFMGTASLARGLVSRRGAKGA